MPTAGSNYRAVYTRYTGVASRTVNWTLISDRFGLRQIPERTGENMSYDRFATPRGNRFGHNVSFWDAALRNLKDYLETGESRAELPLDWIRDSPPLLDNGDESS
jgi:hypothetical protein